MKRRKRRPECVAPRARGTRLRVGPRKGTLEYVEETRGTRLRVAQRWRCSTPDDFAAEVENLCIIRATATGHLPYRPSLILRDEERPIDCLQLESGERR